ncbi:MAG TPA: 5-formyltetrahydrofolate cyclo-ligase [Xanthobacteraceae bacterium]|nr:5-formyltetrahydrofolate cyclo-ligase [Xanthobacteraceae bacterium]
MSLSSSTDNLKAEIRQQARALRDAIAPAARAAAAKVIAARPFPVAVPAGAIVSGFFPLGAEISPMPLMKRLAEGGAKLALPVVAGRGKPLVMRAYAFGDALDSGVWGIQEPKAGAPEVDPDILIVPLLAFDRRGYRVGYGAGYYDMTIKRLRGLKPVVALGIAFALQEVPLVPATERDAALDFVLTERDVIDCRATPG